MVCCENKEDGVNNISHKGLVDIDQHHPMSQRVSPTETFNVLLYPLIVVVTTRLHARYSGEPFVYLNVSQLRLTLSLRGYLECLDVWLAQQEM
jgi:hypothetical protein